jgi:hypothetical protein
MACPAAWTVANVTVSAKAAARAERKKFLKRNLLETGNRELGF